MKMEVWLVRHGETEYNAKLRFCGREDPPLTEKGRSQARQLRPLLASERYDCFVSSPARRAIETARLCYGDPKVDERLSELDFGDIEGLTWDECSMDVRESLLNFDDFTAPNGESVAQMGERVMASVRELGPGRHLMVTHGGVIRWLVGLASVRAYPQLASMTRVTLEVDGEDSARVEVLEASRKAAAP